MYLKNRRAANHGWRGEMIIGDRRAFTITYTQRTSIAPAVGDKFPFFFLFFVLKSIFLDGAVFAHVFVMFIRWWPHIRIHRCVRSGSEIGVLQVSRSALAPGDLDSAA